LNGNEDLEAIARKLSVMLRNVETRGHRWRAPPRADELARSLERIYAAPHRVELEKLRSLKAVSQEAERVLRALKATRPPKPAFSHLLDIVVAFRDLSAWKYMIQFIRRASVLYSDGGADFARLHPIAQQYGMALNRNGQWDEAERVLIAADTSYGHDAETLGTLGRVYKDRWLRSRRRPETTQYLLKSITAYGRGLLANPGEVYPAINLVTLFQAGGLRLTAVEFMANHVSALLQERQRGGSVDYFDYAAAVELYASFGSKHSAEVMLDQALQRARASWELETTAANLEILRSRSNYSGQPWFFLKDLRRRLETKALQIRERRPVGSDKQREIH
jgi:hypothetical protein